MERGYYDVASALGEAETVQSVWTYGAGALGHLDPEHDSSRGHDLRPGARFRVPYWLAKRLQKRGSMLQTELPRHHRVGSFRSKLEIDATAVDLREKSPFFFETGIAMGGGPDPDKKLMTLLHNTFADRYKVTSDTCQHTSDAEYTRSIRGLDNAERVLFELGRRSAKEYSEWKGGKLGRIKTADLIRKKGLR